MIVAGGALVDLGLELIIQWPARARLAALDMIAVSIL